MLRLPRFSFRQPDSLDEAAAGDLMASLSQEFDVPAVDPVRTGVGAIVDRLS